MGLPSATGLKSKEVAGGCTRRRRRRVATASRRRAAAPSQRAAAASGGAMRLGVTADLAVPLDEGSAALTALREALRSEERDSDVYFVLKARVDRRGGASAAAGAAAGGKRGKRGGAADDGGDAAGGGGPAVVELGAARPEECLRLGSEPTRARLPLSVRRRAARQQRDGECPVPGGAALGEARRRGGGALWPHGGRSRTRRADGAAPCEPRGAQSRCPGGPRRRSRDDRPTPPPPAPAPGCSRRTCRGGAPRRRALSTAGLGTSTTWRPPRRTPARRRTRLPRPPRRGGRRRLVDESDVEAAAADVYRSPSVAPPTRRPPRRGRAAEARPPRPPPPRPRTAKSGCSVSRGSASSTSSRVAPLAGIGRSRSGRRNAAQEAASDDLKAASSPGGVAAGQAAGQVGTLTVQTSMLSAPDCAPPARRTARPRHAPRLAVPSAACAASVVARRPLVPVLGQRRAQRRRQHRQRRGRGVRTARGQRRRGRHRRSRRGRRGAAPRSPTDVSSR